jgi:hypothetical protein
LGLVVAEAVGVEKDVWFATSSSNKLNRSTTLYLNINSNCDLRVHSFLEKGLIRIPMLS